MRVVGSAPEEVRAKPTHAGPRTAAQKEERVRVRLSA